MAKPFRALPGVGQPTAVETADGIANGDLTCVEAVEAALARIADLEPSVRAFVEVDSEGSLSQAKRLDREGPKGPLRGVPVAVKETIDVAGLRCTRGSPIHRDRVPAADAVAVRMLRAAGAVIIGTVTSTEFAIGRPPATVNPRFPDRSPGGSSTGSAAAVAAGMVPMALGSQTVGSILRPAAYCGIYGLKPTFGLIPTAGSFGMSELLDHVGFLAGNPADLALALKAFAPAGPGTCPELRRVVTVSGFLDERVGSPSGAALERARQAFGSAVPVEDAVLPPAVRRAQWAIETILYRDLSVALRSEREGSADLLGPALKTMLDIGATVSEADYAEAAEVRRLCTEAVVGLLRPGTVILAAVVDGVPPLRSDHTGPNQLQGLWTLAGVPAVAVPCGLWDGMPVAVQLVGAPGGELPLLAAAALLGVLPGSG